MTYLFRALTQSYWSLSKQQPRHRNSNPWPPHALSMSFSIGMHVLEHTHTHKPTSIKLFTNISWFIRKSWFLATCLYVSQCNYAPFSDPHFFFPREFFLISQSPLGLIQCIADSCKHCNSMSVYFGLWFYYYYSLNRLLLLDTHKNMLV